MLYILREKGICPFLPSWVWMNLHAFQMGWRKNSVLIINWPCMRGKNHVIYYGLLFHVECKKKLKAKFMEDVKKNGVVITQVSLFISYILETFSFKQLKNYGLNKVWELTKYYNGFKSPLCIKCLGV